MAIKHHIIPGQTFGRLTVLADIKVPTSNGRLSRRILAQCSCGVIGKYLVGNLMSGDTHSCGCIHREMVSARGREQLTTHGMTETREYKSWSSALRRCYNRDCAQFRNYGGRGIEVCGRWRNSFENFYADMGPRPPGTSLDRYPDVNGNYEPGNCRWATQTEQSNNRRTNRYIEFQGRTQTLADWAREYDLPRQIVAKRLLRSGWPIKDALETPIAPRRKPKKVCIEYCGKCLTVAQWAEETGVKPVTIYSRYRKGWPPERILAK
jgi:hypothetical protein